MSAVGPLTGRGRALRVVLLGGSSLVLATGAHTLGGGPLPSPAVLAVTGFVLGLVALLVTTRRVRLPLLLGGLGVQQVLLHVLFDAAAASAACTSTATAGLHPHGGVETMGGLSCGQPMAAMSASAAMVAAHVAATLATAWLLARGEAWCWRTTERVVRATGSTATLRRTVRRPRPLGLLAYAAARSAVGTVAAPRGPPPVLV